VQKDDGQAISWRKIDDDNLFSEKKMPDNNTCSAEIQLGGIYLVQKVLQRKEEKDNFTRYTVER
jgi:hypothetical protein